MTAHCANPNCNRQFWQLNKGKLFLLPPSGDSADSMWRVQNLTDHCYWLCPECSLTCVIERQGTEVMVSRRDSTTRIMLRRTQAA